MRALLLATTNRHKLDEFYAIFSDLPLTLRSLREVQIDADVEETAQTFAENAELKARFYAEASGLLSLADDSGLEIDALGGAPGVYSARFAGRETGYEERFRLILEQMRELTGQQRRARFRCALALAGPGGQCRVVEGAIEGIFADHPRGEHGFGYDPIFLLPELGKTFAELTSAQKNRISHRGRAAQLAHVLLEYFG
jgi:XTP/dITP diphosphohydrolase